MIVISCQNPFAPAVIGPSRVVPIVKQTSPDSVLHNFKYAYEHHDIDVYENCLDKQFVFRYIDQDRTGQIEQVEIPRDGPSGDLARTERLFRLFDEITLDTWVPIFDRQEFPQGDTWRSGKSIFICRSRISMVITATSSMRQSVLPSSSSARSSRTISIVWFSGMTNRANDGFVGRADNNLDLTFDYAQNDDDPNQAIDDTKLFGLELSF